MASIQIKWNELTKSFMMKTIFGLHGLNKNISAFNGYQQALWRDI